jgi:hypothetical protein
MKRLLRILLGLISFPTATYLRRRRKSPESDLTIERAANPTLTIEETTPSRKTTIKIVLSFSILFLLALAAFGLLSLPLERMDFWLKVSTGALLILNLPVSIWASGSESKGRTLKFAVNTLLVLTTLVALGALLTSQLVSEIEAGKLARALDDAGNANKAAETLKTDNLVLQGQVATLQKGAAEASKDVAGLIKAAADAKAAQQQTAIDLSNAIARQQKTQTQLARQQEKTAKSERALLELQERLKPRWLTPERADRLTKLLSAKPKGSVFIRCVTTPDSEPCNFARQLATILHFTGWKITGLQEEMYANLTPQGLALEVPFPPLGTAEVADSLLISFNDKGVGAPLRVEWKDRREGENRRERYVVLAVGVKPPR